MYFEDLKPGMSWTTPPAVIEKEKMLDFARLYDNSPLHTDEEYAKTTHFGGLIAPGVMAFMCVWVKFLDMGIFSKDFLAGKATKLEWLKPVYPGDTLTGVVKVTRLERRNAKNGLVEVTTDVFNQKGQLVMLDWTEVIVKSKPTE